MLSNEQKNKIREEFHNKQQAEYWNISLGEEELIADFFLSQFDSLQAEKDIEGSHPTENGYCCACSYDIVCLEGKIAEAKEELRGEIEEKVKEIDRCARILQKSFCLYGTTEGDKRTCDCKFAFDSEKQEYKKELGNKFGEESGCAEARRIIWKLDEVLQIIK